MRYKFFFLLCAFVNIFTKQAPVVTIYVHGTQHISKILPKDVWYCPKGLCHISESSDECMVTKDAKILQERDKELFNLEHYYTFGWSGKLSFKDREHAGRKLYEEVQKLLKTYKKRYGAYPRVRVVTFSHGGNVALNMVKNLPFIGNHKVDLELVLIACPVQKVTEYLINHKDISHSYIISSNLDLLQIADTYKYKGKRYLPKRFFDAARDNCHQVAVTVNKKRLGHVDLWHSYMRHIPSTIRAATRSKGKEILEYNVDDTGFVFYRGYNFPWSMRAYRKI